MSLRPHFTLAELCASSTAERLEIVNAPPPDVQEHLKVTASGMEQVRALLGHAVRIDSGYRCPALNRAVNGAPNSAHLNGYAVDFVCPDYGAPQQVVDAIRGSGISFDQVIYEGSWVHISFDPRHRREYLIAHFGAGGTTYTQGV
jgi:putative chitinase